MSENDATSDVVVMPAEIDLVKFVIKHLLDYTTQWSHSQLVRLVRDEFNISYTIGDLFELFDSPTFHAEWPLSGQSSDPRSDIVRAEFANLALEAMTQLKSLLSDPHTPATVRLRTIEKVMEMNDIKPQPARKSNANEMVEWMRDRGVHNVTQVNIGTLIQHLPDGYAQAEDAVANPTALHNLIESMSSIPEDLQDMVPGFDSAEEFDHGASTPYEDGEWEEEDDDPEE